ncbi:hypothetical protein LDENG_00046380, partial [Lucifuga dentata]
TENSQDGEPAPVQSRLSPLALLPIRLRCSSVGQHCFSFIRRHLLVLLLLQRPGDVGILHYALMRRSVVRRSRVVRHVEQNRAGLYHPGCHDATAFTVRYMCSLSDSSFNKDDLWCLRFPVAIGTLQTLSITDGKHSG